MKCLREFLRRMFGARVPLKYRMWAILQMDHVNERRFPGDAMPPIAWIDADGTEVREIPF